MAEELKSLTFEEKAKEGVASITAKRKALLDIAKTPFKVSTNFAYSAGAMGYDIKTIRDKNILMQIGGFLTGVVQNQAAFAGEYSLIPVETKWQNIDIKNWRDDIALRINQLDRDEQLAKLDAIEKQLLTLAPETATELAKDSVLDSLKALLGQ